MNKLIPRVTKSSINWDRLHSLVPKDDYTNFKVLKGRTEEIVAKISQLPSHPIVIDFEKYSKKITDPKVLAFINDLNRISKQEIPYPEDKQKVKEKVYDMTETALQVYNKQITDAQTLKEKLAVDAKKWEKFPSPEEWTEELLIYYFPDHWVPKHYELKSKPELFEEFIESKMK
ncbi:hypothetical protein GJ496_009793 [Pomphorhynchus laevis]|nr:hypothetical protein GJ496_009793 [Pomphorhynchus laevis]